VPTYQLVRAARLSWSNVTLIEKGRIYMLYGMLTFPVPTISEDIPRVHVGFSHDFCISPWPHPYLI